jgi:hypothetical protein
MASNNGNKIYNIFINSANRSKNDKPYDFTVFFDNDEIMVNNNEGVNVNIVSFSLLNSMYNINQYTKNNTFSLVDNALSTSTTFTIPYGNYNVYTLMNELNALLSGIITVSYNVATNTYTYKNITASSYSINPLTCSKLLGLTTITSISPLGTTSSYVNMVNYQQVILRCPTMVFENNSMDNIQDKNNFISISDILYWINKQDVEPFKMINYKNEDASTLYSYNVVNRSFSYFNFKLVNEFDEPIYDAPDYLLQMQIIIYDKDNTYFKEAVIQALKLLNDIYFTILNIVSLLIKK